jgi:hypothetical protein
MEPQFDVPIHRRALPALVAVAPPDPPATVAPQNAHGRGIEDAKPD